MRTRELIVACVATLMLTGLVMVYSNTAVSCGLNPAANEFVAKQAMWVCLSLCAIMLFAHIDYHLLARHSRLIMLLTLLALAVLLVAGTKRNGARRWFRLGPMSLQVSEFAKIAVVLFVAGFVSRKRAILGNLKRGFAPPVLILCAVFTLIMLQPDFGTAVLIMAVGMAMLVCAGVCWKHSLLLAAAAAPLLFVFLRMSDYRWRRIIAFITPWKDAKGLGYHVCQSLIALGSGGWTGVGPGRGLQKLGFLPEAETDFIFAIIGQETGLLGCLLLISVFAALFYAGMRVCRAAPDVLGGVLALGVTLLIGLQMFINVAVAASAMPTKGISLPFVSFGGSSLLAFSIGVGILLNVSRQCPRDDLPAIRGARARETAT